MSDTGAASGDWANALTGVAMSVMFAWRAGRRTAQTEIASTRTASIQGRRTSLSVRHRRPTTGMPQDARSGCERIGIAAEVEHLAGVPTVLSQFDRGDGSEGHRHHALRPGPQETRHDGLTHAG